MAIVTGANGSISLAAHNDDDDASVMFGDDTGSQSSTAAMIYDGRINNWTLITHRQMNDATPMGVDADEFYPGSGGGVVLVRGWIDSTDTGLTTNVGKYNREIGAFVPGAEDSDFTALLVLSDKVGADVRKYRMHGWVENLRIENPVDAPQRFSGLIRVSGDISIVWAT